MLTELVAGDSYGMAFEYSSPKFVEENNTVDHYVFIRGRRTGRYGDDAQMSIANAEIMVEGLPWTKLTCASKYVQVFGRDQRKGYAGGFYKFLQEVQTGEEFLEKIKPNSDKSGGMMRAPVIGLYPTVSDVIRFAEIQASVTHDTPDGKSAAIAAALMTHYFAYDLGDKKDLPEFIQSYVPGDNWTTEYVGAVGAKGWMSCRAALTAIVKNDTLTDILRASIAFTGDVDTVAAVAMGAASMSREVEQNLSPLLYTEMDNGPYGYDFVKELDGKLMAKFNEWKAAGAVIDPTTITV